jgi:DNA-directed RNA polymerase subunit M/transcription elongation factor TFIIS
MNNICKLNPNAMRSECPKEQRNEAWEKHSVHVSEEERERIIAERKLECEKCEYRTVFTTKVTRVDLPQLPTTPKCEKCGHVPCCGESIEFGCPKCGYRK